MIARHDEKQEHELMHGCTDVCMDVCMDVLDVCMDVCRDGLKACVHASALVFESVCPPVSEMQTLNIFLYNMYTMYTVAINGSHRGD
jgi:hypothetical protein